jgi:nitrogen fixation protein FixH
MDQGTEMRLSTPSTITGRNVFLALLAFFGLIIGVNTTLAVLANRSWTGLVVENGYVESQKFNQELAEARKQAALGWREEFGYRKGLLELRLSGKDGRALSGLSVAVKLERPSSDREDRALTLPETMTGHYALPIILNTGQWDADVTARSSSGETMRRIYRFYVRG